MLADTRISDIMTPDPITLNINDTVDRVHEIFESKSIHHLPVIDNEGALQGIISHIDLMKISYGRSLFRIHNKEALNQTLYRTLLVKDVMTRDVKSLRPDDTISDALALFKKNIFHAIPITHSGRVCGIISCFDLLMYAYNR